jgi:hypothetical protein
MKRTIVILEQATGLLAACNRRFSELRWPLFEKRVIRDYIPGSDAIGA